MMSKKVCQIMIAFLLVPAFTFASQTFYQTSSSGQIYQNNLQLLAGDVIQIWGMNSNVGLCNGCTRSVAIKYRFSTDISTTTLIANQTVQLSGGNDEMPVSSFGQITASSNSTLTIEFDSSAGLGSLMTQVIPFASGGITPPTMTELIFQWTIIFFLIAGSVIWLIRKFS